LEDDHTLAVALLELTTVARDAHVLATPLGLVALGLVQPEADHQRHAQKYEPGMQPHCSLRSLGMMLPKPVL
jgi:hypothetical protein